MLVRLLSLARRLLKRLGLLPVIKRILYSGDTAQVAKQTTGWRYRLKTLIEQAIFASVTEVHELPKIQSYWADRYLRPLLERRGYESPDDFFLQNLERVFSQSDQRSLRCASIGSGNCDFEVGLCEALSRRGQNDFVIECIDINQLMLDRGKALAAARGVAGHIATVRADFNAWRPSGQYDVVLANMALHHVVNLEDLFDRVKSSLFPWGRFVVFDIIGRNGHMRWPEALEIVREFWRELPSEYRYNRMLATHQEEYENFDCSRAGFEGIRAQDILPLLLERFHFEEFIGFANVIEPFIDRSTGYNFDPAHPWDRALIDRVQARDHQELLSGRIKPTHMLAVLSPEPTDRADYIDTMTPDFCVRQLMQGNGDRFHFDTSDIQGTFTRINKSESKPGYYRRLGRRLLYLLAAWFPGGAAISLPCDGSFPAPRRTGLGVLHHPAPSLSLPPRNGVEVMDDPSARQQWANGGTEALPGQRAALTAAIEPLEQQAAGEVDVSRQGAAIAAHTVVLDVPAQVAHEVGQHGRPALRAQAT
ncbi:class I SAM-dependent methyltransferase [Thiocystis violacea]|uniref:class I SAM-dependent methyltransferase n=1 Tax=Thiocystis violacea TaxID=13725 RepID=UPI001F5B44BB|nr:class I SAM-dependent methyltransferase [Thiocystis violacea]